MTAFDPNDERLTAYILGDDSLSAADCAAVAELLATNPEAQRFADELRAAASFAAAELSSEAIPATAPATSIESAVRQELSQRPARKAFLFRAQWLVAAGLLVGVGFYFAPKIREATAPQMAWRDTSRTVAAPSLKRPGTDGQEFATGNAGGYGSPFGSALNEWHAQEGAKAAPSWSEGRVSAPKVSADSDRYSGVVNGPGAFPPRAGAKPPVPARPSSGGTPPAGGAAPGPSPTKPAGDHMYYERQQAAQGRGGQAPHPPGMQAGEQAAGLEGRGVRNEASETPAKARSMKETSEAEVLRRGADPADRADRLEAVPPPKAAAPALPAVVPPPRPAVTRAQTTEEPAKGAKVPGNDIQRHLSSEKVVLPPEEELGVAGKMDGAQPDPNALIKLGRNLGPVGFGLGRHGGYNREAYPVLKENDFLEAKGENARSTFSIDVDTASYSLVRRFLTQNALPPSGAVRLEEIVNYFRYNYEGPKGETPFAAHLEIAECPWNPEHRLARIALKGREIDRGKRPPSNLVFLIDVSGSMDEPNKLPLVKESLKLLVDQLGENDRVAIAVYASGSGLVLDSTNGSKKSDIVYAIDNLRPSGSTNGAAGIQCAYDAAVKGFIKGGVNRVILCTDGDFNVGVTSDDQLVQLITEKAKTGVFLSCLAVGEGNLQDKKMMELANKGNGNYAYLDSVKEAQKVLVEQMSGTLVTIAKDVKIQVEFNPVKVGAYRLLGYEKRMLKNEDFKDDKKDAGEIGAGHTVTALYELVPAGKASPAGKTDPLVFQKPAEPAKVDAELAKAVCLVKLRYKQPDGSTSKEVGFPATDAGKRYTQASEDFRFAAAAASFAMVLRDSPYKGNATMASVLELAAAAKGADPGGYRAEFLKLVEKAKELKK